MRVQLTLFVVALFFATGCEQAQKAKESYSAISKLSEASKDITANLEEAKNQREERQKTGDTLSLPYKELEKFLPTSISGFKAGAPSGQSQKMPGMSFSSTEQEFTKGEETVKVSLIDYNGAGTLYQGASAMLSLGIESENDDQTVGPSSLKIDGVKGMNTFRKKDGNAEMTLAVGGRFLLNMSATKQQDMKFLESVARDMDLEKMAKL